jgi:hypothetical protein
LRPEPFASRSLHSFFFISGAFNLVFSAAALGTFESSVTAALSARRAKQRNKFDQRKMKKIPEHIARKLSKFCLPNSPSVIPLL